MSPRRVANNPLQVARQQTIETIRSWIKPDELKDPETKDAYRQALIRRAQNAFGCTKDKASEYLDVILGEA
jgi:hypothetical protein